MPGGVDVAVQKSKDAGRLALHHRQGRTIAGSGEAMAKHETNLGGAWWAKNLDDVDNEIARLSIACNVRILDPGVIERVLQNDASVCGSRNPAGFEKLRTALKMHYHIRGQTAGSMGEAQTAQIVAEIVERLKTRIGDRLGGSSPAK